MCDRMVIGSHLHIQFESFTNEVFDYISVGDWEYSIQLYVINFASELT